MREDIEYVEPPKPEPPEPKKEKVEEEEENEPQPEIEATPKRSMPASSKKSSKLNTPARLSKKEEEVIEAKVATPQKEPEPPEPEPPKYKFNEKMEMLALEIYRNKIHEH